MKSLMKLENRLKETGYFSEKELAIIIRDLPRMHNHNSSLSLDIFV